MTIKVFLVLKNQPFKSNQEQIENSAVTIVALYHILDSHSKTQTANHPIYMLCTKLHAVW